LIYCGIVEEFYEMDFYKPGAEVTKKDLDEIMDWYNDTISLEKNLNVTD
jgi:hypothetical protein